MSNWQNSKYLSKIENGKIQRLTVARNPPGDNFRLEDPVSNTVGETEHQLAHYYRRRRDSMEGSVQRDQMDAKIRELENHLRRLGGHLAGTPTDQVQAIISGFR